MNYCTTSYVIKNYFGIQGTRKKEESKQMNIFDFE